MGSVVISIDAELGWGFHDFASPPMDRLDRARWGWRSLLALLDEFDVPATWAVVGHLMLTECDGRHADHPVGEAWFARERGSWADRPDLRFAPDLVDRIDAASADHEVASHAFSHVELGGASRAVARAEIETSVALARAQGRSLDSFVFPRNDVGHRDVLAAAGFECYRGRGGWPDSRLRKLADAAGRGDEPRLVVPTVDEYGLVDLPDSLFLFGFAGLPRRVVRSVLGDPVVERVRRGLAAAREAENGVLHLWLHPNNVVDEADVALLRSVLSVIEAHRAAVPVETMGEVARRTRGAPATGDRAPPADRR